MEQKTTRRGIPGIVLAGPRPDHHKSFTVRAQPLGWERKTKLRLSIQPLIIISDGSPGAPRLGRIEDTPRTVPSMECSQKIAFQARVILDPHTPANAIGI